MEDWQIWERWDMNQWGCLEVVGSAVVAQRVSQTHRNTNAQTSEESKRKLKTQSHKGVILLFGVSPQQSFN